MIRWESALTYSAFCPAMYYFFPVRKTAKSFYFFLSVNKIYAEQWYLKAYATLSSGWSAVTLSSSEARSFWPSVQQRCTRRLHILFEVQMNCRRVRKLPDLFSERQFLAGKTSGDTDSCIKVGVCVNCTDYGVYKVEAKTKSVSGVDFNINCSSNHDTKKFVGSLETKYKWSDYGKKNNKCCQSCTPWKLWCMLL